MKRSFVNRHKRSIGLVVCSMFLLPLMLSQLANTAHAAGERYRWLDKDNVEASGGNFGNTKYRFVRSGFLSNNSSGQPITIDQKNGFVKEATSPGFGFPGPSGQNCVLRIGIEISTNDPSKGTIRRDISAELAAASISSLPPCDSPALVSVNPFTQSISLANSNLANNNPQIRNITIRISTVVKSSETYNSDTITLQTVDKKKSLGQKNVDKNNAYVKNDYKGFSVDITFKSNEIGRTEEIEACSLYISKCTGILETRQTLDETGLAAVTINKVYEDSSGGGTSCAIDGIGWLVCPVMTFLGKMTDLAFNFLSTTFLETKASYFDVSGSNNSAYQAWSYMRNLANVAFVIAFLFIIYSQITGFGASNYGIKKLLPKIIIAAILVNISFFICQIAIDISNILGYSLKSLFDTIGTSFKSPDAVTQDASGNGFGIAAIIVGLLAAGIGLALALSIPVILAALLALTIIVFILLARTALIILLVVIAPLAFVAYLLPNTEDWYKKWQKMFTGLLLVFPIIAVVFGAAGLAAKIVNAAAGNDKLLQVMAIGIATIPLFAVPGLLKGAMSAAGAIGARLSAASSKANSGATGSARGKIGEKYKGSAFARGQALRKQGKEEFRNRRFTKAVAGEDTGLVGRMRRRASQGLTGRQFTGAGEFAQDTAEKAAKGASARAEAKDYGEAVEAATAAQRNMSVGDVAAIAASGEHNGGKVTEHERAAAIDRAMASGGFSDRRAVLEGLAGDKKNTSRELRNRAVSAAYSKGDQNIYGAGFGDQILEEEQKEVRDTAGNITVERRGSINGAGDLAAAAVTNAAEGHVAPEHIVQNASATTFLVKATLDSGNTVARGKLAAARDAAKSTASTQAKIDPVIEREFTKL